MSNKKFFLFDCSRAVDCCNKSQYQEASLKEKINLLLHLIICGRCREYTSRNTKLSKLINKAKLKKCSEAEKEIHRKKIKEASTSSNNDT